MKTPRIALMFIALALASSPALADDPDEVTDGEQRVNIGDPGRDHVATARRALAGVEGVSEVSGEKKVNFTIAPGAAVSHNAIKKTLDVHQGVDVKPPRLGFDLTVDIVLKEGMVSEEQVPKIIDSLPTYDELARIEHAGGRILRLRTAPWAMTNQRGFDVNSLTNRIAGATGYRGPEYPRFHMFVEDIIFRSGDDSASE